MPRPAHTPLLDNLLDELQTALDYHGGRSDLARALAASSGITLPAARNRVSRILGRQMVPNGEDTLILAAFLDSLPDR